MGWTAGVLFPADARDFSLLHGFQTGSGVHLASEALSPGVKRQEREAHDAPPPSAEVKNGGAIPPTPICLHGVVLIN
jgi:hypothetical protein